MVARDGFVSRFGDAKMCWQLTNFPSLRQSDGLSQVVHYDITPPPDFCANKPLSCSAGSGAQEIQGDLQILQLRGQL